MPELWPRVLGNLSRLIDGAGGILFTVNSDRIRWTASPDIYDLIDEFIRDGWAAINPRPVRLARINHFGFAVDHEHFTAEELENDPVYTRFYRKRGLGWAAGTMLDVPSGDSIIFSFEKAFAKGPVDARAVSALDQLRPHLARAALLACRFDMEKSRAMVAAFAKVGLPSATLGKSGRLLAASEDFHATMERVLEDRVVRVKFKDAAIDSLFEQSLESIRVGAFGAAQIYSIPIAAVDDEVPLIVHLVPIQRSAHDVFSSATTLLVVTPVDRSAVPSAKVIAGLFDLSPAEARIAREVAAGSTLEGIADLSGVSRETVRTQLKSVLAKTGMSRQADLVALLSGLVLPR